MADDRYDLIEQATRLAEDIAREVREEKAGVRRITPADSKQAGGKKK